MKKLAILSILAVFFAGAVHAQESTYSLDVAPAAAPVKSPYNFGDHRSSTLVSKAWQAFAEKNLDAVQAYTNKCLELYEEKAKEMQANLKDYPAGDDQKIFSYWAINDVSTALFIRGEAFRQVGKMEEAKTAFSRIVNEFSYGQCYDVGKKLFWKPVDAANDKLNMMAKGLDLDFGDMSSSYITGQAWASLAKKDLELVTAYVNKNVDMYGAKAKEMQAGLKEFPWESNQKIFSYWALNDVGTCLFIQGKAFRMAGKKAEALDVFKRVVENYGFAQCWDPQGWFWKPAEAAQQQIYELEAIN